jgi:hypothetical protein
VTGGVRCGVVWREVGEGVEEAAEAVEADNPQGCGLPGRVATSVDECAQFSAREARKAASLDKLPLHRDKPQ